MVLIARFQCQADRKKKLTFSLLPHQLAPYRQYTVRSMVFALLLAQAFCQRKDPGLVGIAAEVISDQSYGESRVTGYLVADWLLLFVASLRRGHKQLSVRYDLTQIRSRDGQQGRLGEVWTYLSVLVRGPPIPRIRQNIDSQLAWYANCTGRFLIGFPSQERGQ